MARLYVVHPFSTKPPVTLDRAKALAAEGETLQALLLIVTQDRHDGNFGDAALAAYTRELLESLPAKDSDTAYDIARTLYNIATPHSHMSLMLKALANKRWQDEKIADRYYAAGSPPDETLAVARGHVQNAEPLKALFKITATSHSFGHFLDTAIVGFIEELLPLLAAAEGNQIARQAISALQSVYEQLTLVARKLASLSPFKFMDFAEIPESHRRPGNMTPDQTLRLAEAANQSDGSLAALWILAANIPGKSSNAALVAFAKATLADVHAKNPALVQHVAVTLYNSVSPRSAMAAELRLYIS